MTIIAAARIAERIDNSPTERLPIITQGTVAGCDRPWCTIGDHSPSPGYHASDLIEVAGWDEMLDPQPVTVAVHASTLDPQPGWPVGEPTRIYLQLLEPEASEPVRFDLDEAVRLAHTILALAAAVGGNPK